MLPQLEQLEKDYEIIFLCKFGSHLYGTNTPSSDTDYKGIYIPTVEQCIEGEVKKSINLDTNSSDCKNTSEDIDCEIYSIQHFLRLAVRGETVALDMLHCNRECTVIGTPKWDYIRGQRQRFYSKNMTAFVGYAQKQAAKYGLKGSRIASAKLLLNFLKTFDLESRMFEHWKALPTDENMFHAPNKDVAMKSLMFNFCGKQIQSTAKVKYIIEMIEKFTEQYGARAKSAEKNEGVDWKAISHALRAAYQLKEIYIFKDLVFPLVSADYLKEVKTGQHDFKKVLTELETQITSIKLLAETSSFPETVNSGYASLILKKLYRGVFHEHD